MSETLSYGYPGLYLGGGLAANGTEGTFVPVQIWAGEQDIITTDETIAEFGALPQYLAMGRRADGKLVPLVPVTTDALEALSAKGSYTFSAAPAAGDTVTIGGVVITWEAAPVAPAVLLPNQVAIGVDAPTSAQNLIDYLFQNEANFSVQPDQSSSGGSVVIVEADAPGTAGNAITIAKSSTAIAVSGSTLAGGSATTTENVPESRLVAVLGQAIDTSNGDVQGPVYIGGCFNYQGVIWPPNVTTLLMCKQLTDGTRMSVRALK